MYFQTVIQAVSEADDIDTQGNIGRYSKTLITAGLPCNSCVNLSVSDFKILIYESKVHNGSQLFSLADQMRLLDYPKWTNLLLAVFANQVLLLKRVKVGVLSFICTSLIHPHCL